MSKIKTLRKYAGVSMRYEEETTKISRLYLKEL